MIFWRLYSTSTKKPREIWYETPPNYRRCAFVICVFQMLHYSSSGNSVSNVFVCVYVCMCDIQDIPIPCFFSTGMSRTQHERALSSSRENSDAVLIEFIGNWRWIRKQTFLGKKVRWILYGWMCPAPRAWRFWPFIDFYWHPAFWTTKMIYHSMVYDWLWRVSYERQNRVSKGSARTKWRILHHPMRTLHIC